MAKANYVHDGPPPGIDFEATVSSSPPASEMVDLDGEVPDLLSQFDALDSANGYRLYSGGGRGQNQGLA